MAIIVLLAGTYTGHFSMKPLNKDQFAKMAIPALLNSLQLLTSLKSLPYVAIATTVVFRNISTLVTATIEVRTLPSHTPVQFEGERRWLAASANDGHIRSARPNQPAPHTLADVHRGYLC